MVIIPLCFLYFQKFNKLSLCLKFFFVAVFMHRKGKKERKNQTEEPKGPIGPLDPWESPPSIIKYKKRPTKNSTGSSYTASIWGGTVQSMTRVSFLFFKSSAWAGLRYRFSYLPEKSPIHCYNRSYSRGGCYTRLFCFCFFTQNLLRYALRRKREVVEIHCWHMICYYTWCLVISCTIQYPLGGLCNALLRESKKVCDWKVILTRLLTSSKTHIAPAF